MFKDFKTPSLQTDAGIKLNDIVMNMWNTSQMGNGLFKLNDKKDFLRQYGNMLNQFLPYTILYLRKNKNGFSSEQLGWIADENYRRSLKYEY
jgi:hypothetical protein